MYIESNYEKIIYWILQIKYEPKNNLKLDKKKQPTPFYSDFFILCYNWMLRLQSLIILRSFRIELNREQWRSKMFYGTEARGDDFSPLRTEDPSNVVTADGINKRR